jgi:hypothetical protein
MDIRQALAQLYRIERGLSISVPYPVKIKRVYPYSPGPNATLEAPAFTNSYTLAGYDRGGGSFRTQLYAVHIQLSIDDAAEVAADIATSFLVEFLDQLDRDPNLANSCTHAVPRGGDPTLAEFVRSNKTYIGLDMFLDVTMKEGKTFPS